VLVRRLWIVGVIVVLGFGLGLALPRWRVITVVFEPGGRTWHVAGESPRPLPATLDVDDDGRLRLRVLNLDTVIHDAGVLAVNARDSAVVPADICTGTHRTGANTIVLR
jgi:hypothetical protein